MTFHYVYWLPKSRREDEAVHSRKVPSCIHPTRRLVPMQQAVLSSTSKSTGRKQIMRATVVASSKPLCEHVWDRQSASWPKGHLTLITVSVPRQVGCSLKDHGESGECCILLVTPSCMSCHFPRSSAGRSSAGHKGGQQAQRPYLQPSSVFSPSSAARPTSERPRAPRPETVRFSNTSISAITSQHFKKWHNHCGIPTVSLALSTRILAMDDRHVSDMLQRSVAAAGIPSTCTIVLEQRIFYRSSLCSNPTRQEQRWISYPSLRKSAFVFGTIAIRHLKSWQSGCKLFSLRQAGCRFRWILLSRLHLCITLATHRDV